MHAGETSGGHAAKVTSGHAAVGTSGHAAVGTSGRGAVAATPHAGVPPGSTAPAGVAGWPARVAAQGPEAATRLALSAADARLSPAGLAALAERTAAALQASGIGRGDAVAWLGLNSAAMLGMLFGCARLGAMLMPLNWRLAPPEHAAMLRECPPRLFVVDAEFAAASKEARVAPPGALVLERAVPAGQDHARAAASSFDAWLDAAPERPAGTLPAVDAATPLLLCFTSGSTGKPKGVLLSQDALDANADASVDMHGLSADDRVLTTLPLFHVGGLNILTTPALREGASVVLHAKFDPDACLDAIERERITLTVLVPAQLEALMAHPRWAGADLGSLRMITTGSTLVPERLIRAVQARGIPLVTVWGATETCPIAAALHADEAWHKVGSTGRAARGVELRLVDPFGQDVPGGASGELLVRGRNVMLGYWGDEAATRRALAGGWFHSGDSAHADADGFLTIDGRLKDMIISGGENVSPAEVEAVLLGDARVAAASVVGRPDARWGEVVVAVVVPAPGAALDAAAVRAMFDGRLARFKQPKDVLIVDALPATALGKVRKDDVRALVARHFAEAAPACPPVSDPTPPCLQEPRA